MDSNERGDESAWKSQAMLFILSFFDDVNMFDIRI